MGKRKDYRPGGKKSTLDAPASAQLTRTADGFDNFSARLGMGQDNLLAKSGYHAGACLTGKPQELEEMYRTSWVTARMVEVVAEDMTRSGLDLQTTMDEGDKGALLKGYRASGTKSRLTDAIKWGRLYGGATAMILIDGQDPATPLEDSSISVGGYRGLHVLDRHQLVSSNEKISELGPMLGYPMYYAVNTESVSGLRVHHSRMLRFVGVDLPARVRISEQHWGASVVERAYDRILALDSATHGTANLLFRSYLRVIGVENYRSILAAGGKSEAALLKMFTHIRQMQSNEGVTVLDSKDTFHTHSWSFAGVYEAIQTFNEQISGALGVPLVRLMGQSPKGFSSGDSDLRTYYDTVLTQLDDDLAAPHLKLFSILSHSLWGRPLPEDFSIEYRSLWAPTELEKSQIATADAQSAAGLYGAGVISRGQALAELKDSSRLTGRFSGINDAEIDAASREAVAPALSEGFEENYTSATEPEGHTPQEISLNGAQVSSMVDIVSQVAAGLLPRASGVEMLLAAFPLSAQQAESIMGDVGKTFAISPETIA